MGNASASSEAILSLPPTPYDHRIPYGDDPSQFVDLRLPKTHWTIPVVVVIHGGFWRSRYNLDHISHLCSAVTERGFATWSVEYRRVGNPGGGFPNTLLDVSTAMESLRGHAGKYNLDLSRVVVMGHSAGGHLALWMAGRHRVPKHSALAMDDQLTIRAAISLAGVSDLRLAWHLGLGSGATAQLTGGSPEEVAEHYSVASPFELLPLGVPQFILHGTVDEDVPFTMSEHYVSGALARGDSAKLVRLEGIGHLELIDPQSRAWPIVLENIRSALG